MDFLNSSEVHEPVEDSSASIALKTIYFFSLQIIRHAYVVKAEYVLSFMQQVIPIISKLRKFLYYRLKQYLFFVWFNSQYNC